LKFDRVLGNGENVGECQDKAGKPGTVSVQAYHVVPLKSQRSITTASRVHCSQIDVGLM